jgi:hypothetical protein
MAAAHHHAGNDVGGQGVGVHDGVFRRKAEFVRSYYCPKRCAGIGPSSRKSRLSAGNARQTGVSSQLPAAAESRPAPSRAPPQTVRIGVAGTAVVRQMQPVTRPPAGFARQTTPARDCVRFLQ